MGVHLINGLFEVEVMADSYVLVPKGLWPDGYHRLTSLRVIAPRMILAEFNTHRLLSRNSASSRAESAEKMLRRVKSKPFVPDRFPLDHSGMQQLDEDAWVKPGDTRFETFTAAWNETVDELIAISQRLHDLEISKQLTNRFVEPVSMHQIIVTASEWENFFYLRADTPAQNEIRLLAELMLKSMNESTPQKLEPGAWHLPFGERIDETRLASTLGDTIKEGDSLLPYILKIVVARCARVSFFNFEGKDDYEADLKLFKRLNESGHWSPFEHVARAMNVDEYCQHTHTYSDRTEYGWCGNFRGFIQMRKHFPHREENRTEPRLRKLVV